MLDTNGKFLNMPFVGWIPLAIAAVVCFDRLLLILGLTAVIFLCWKFRSKFRRALEWTGENIRKQLNK